MTPMIPTRITTRFAKMQNVRENKFSFPSMMSGTIVLILPYYCYGWFWWPDAGDDNVSLYLLRLLMLHLNSSWVGIRGKKCPLMGNSWASGSWSLTSRNHRLNITKVAQGAKTDPRCNDTASKLSKWSLVRFTEAFIKYLRLYFLLWSHKWDWVQFPFSFSWVMTPVQLKMSTQFNYIRTHSVERCMFYVNLHSSSSCWTWTSFHKSLILVKRILLLLVAQDSMGSVCAL